jgi:hypothetical protein
VLGADVFVVEALGLLVCQGHDLSRSISETFKHWCLQMAGNQAGGT